MHATCHMAFLKKTLPLVLSLSRDTWVIAISKESPQQMLKRLKGLLHEVMEENKFYIV